MLLCRNSGENIERFLDVEELASGSMGREDRLPKPELCCCRLHSDVIQSSENDRRSGQPFGIAGRRVFARHLLQSAAGRHISEQCQDSHLTFRIRQVLLFRADQHLERAHVPVSQGETYQAGRQISYGAYRGRMERLGLHSFFHTRGMMSPLRYQNLEDGSWKIKLNFSLDR